NGGHEFADGAGYPDGVRAFEPLCSPYFGNAGAPDSGDGGRRFALRASRRTQTSGDMMAGHAAKPVNRKVGILVFAFNALFGAMVALPYLPFGQTPAIAQTVPADAPIATLTLE